MPGSPSSPHIQFLLSSPAQETLLGFEAPWDVLGSAEPPFQQAQGWDVSSWDTEGCVLLGTWPCQLLGASSLHLNHLEVLTPTPALCPCVPSDALSRLSSLMEHDVHV